MPAPPIIAVVTDGTSFWTEVFEGGEAAGATMTRHVDRSRWTSVAEATSQSPWWPSDQPGGPAPPELERLHRATCSWLRCTHHVVWSAGTSPITSSAPSLARA